MRVCIYKTDDAPDLTLFLKEGLAFPGDKRDQNWLPLKTVTGGEVRTDIMSKLSRTGCCVEDLGTISTATSVGVAPPRAESRISLRWLSLPRQFRP